MKLHADIAKATGNIAGMTLVSRILGFIRDAIIASSFGTGMAADAFFVAFRIPNILRDLLAEGALSAGFVPVFTETYTQKGKTSLWELMRIISILLFLISLFLAILGIIFAPLLVRIIAPGFIHLPDKLELTISLTRVIFPYIIFIGLAAVGMGALNSLRHFTIPAFSPAFFNLALISFMIFVCPHLETPIFGLAAGVIVGGIGQLLIQIPPLIRQGWNFTFSFSFKEIWLAIKTHPQIKKISLLLTPAVFGLAIHQLSFLIDTLIASFLPAGSVSYLYYGNRLMQLPLGIFGISLATAALPTLAALAARKDLESFKQTFDFSLRSTFFITLPAIIGLIVLRFPIIRLLFGRGAFDNASIEGSAGTLLFYSLGLCSYAGMKVVVTSFYALQDTRTPIKIGALALIINTVLNLLLMGPLKSGGIALATSLSSTVSFFMLTLILRKRIGPLGLKRTMKSFIKILLSALSMGVICLLVSNGLTKLDMSFPARLIQVSLAIISGLMTYLLISLFLKVEEVDFLKKVILKTNR